MATQIEHSGIVSEVKQDRVVVIITSESACGSCKAREACGLSEAQEKRVVVTTDDAAQYAAGDSVVVGVKRSAGALSVALAYVGALVVLMAVLVIGIVVFTWSEGLAALAAMGSVVIYYVVLWLFRRKIEHTIQFTITKI